jgi:hypothetical protein
MCVRVLSLFVRCKLHNALQVMHGYGKSETL